MSDKVLLLGNKCQCSDTSSVLVALVHFWMCIINYCAELHVGEENCLKSFLKTLLKNSIEKCVLQIVERNIDIMILTCDVCI